MEGEERKREEAAAAVYVCMFVRSQLVSKVVLPRTRNLSSTNSILCTSRGFDQLIPREQCDQTVDGIKTSVTGKKRKKEEVIEKQAVEKRRKGEKPYFSNFFGFFPRFLLLHLYT